MYTYIYTYILLSPICSSTAIGRRVRSETSFNLMFDTIIFLLGIYTVSWILIQFGCCLFWTYFSCINVGFTCPTICHSKTHILLCYYCLCHLPLFLWIQVCLDLFVYLYVPIFVRFWVGHQKIVLCCLECSYKGGGEGGRGGASTVAYVCHTQRLEL